jgi:hypothetical protein
MSAYFEGSAFISVGGGLVIHASAASFCFWNMLDPIPASRWCVRSNFATTPKSSSSSPRFEINSPDSLGLIFQEYLSYFIG